MNVKVKIKSQLNDYIAKENVISQEEEVVETVVRREFSEYYFKRVFSADDNCKFVAERDERDTPILVKIDKHEAKKSKLSDFIDKWTKPLLIFCFLAAIVSFFGLVITSNPYFALLYLPATIFIAIGIYNISLRKNSPPDNSINYVTEHIVISSKDWRLFENLRKYRKECNFENLYELFAESYLDFKTSNSKQAKEANLLIAERIIETIQVFIDTEEEKETMSRNNIDNKWEIVKKELT